MMTIRAGRSNAYFFDGLLIEPTSRDAEGLESWVSFVEDKKPQALVCTHWHLDNVLGVRDLSERTGVPVWGPASLGLLSSVHPRPERILGPGDRLGAGSKWRVVDSPGHALSHVCLFDGETLILGDAVFVGDGRPHEYLTTLLDLAALDPVTALPGHGEGYYRRTFRPWMRTLLGEPHVQALGRQP